MANTVPVVGGTDQSYLVTVVMNGTNVGVFDTWSGGDAVAKSNKHRPGGMGDEVAYASLPSFTDMTVGRVLEADRDWDLVGLITQYGGRVPGSITIQPLDADGNAYNSSRTATGVFLGVKGLKADSTSDAIQMYELDFAVTSW